MFSYVSDNGLTLGMSRLTESQQAAIIPKKELFTAGGIDVGARFFQLTIGHAITNPLHLQTFFSVIKAISAMGNIIVVTFTVARGSKPQLHSTTCN
jgi:hypothetical protein